MECLRYLRCVANWSRPASSARQFNERTHVVIAGVELAAAPVFDRLQLQGGHTITGPAVIDESTSTTVLPPGSSAVVDAVGSLIIDTGVHRHRDTDHRAASVVCAVQLPEPSGSAQTTSVRFVVSGGLDADEDVACAEVIAQLLENQSVEPTPYLDRARRSAAALELERGVLAGFTGVTSQDVQMCLDVDRFDFAMQAVASGAQLNLTRTDPANPE